MKRFVLFAISGMFAAVVLSACGASANCNAASYPNGQLPAQCYAQGGNQYPGTGYPPTGYPGQGYPPPGYPAQPPYQGGGVWVGGGYVAGGGYFGPPNPYGYPCAGNPYCYGGRF